MLPSVVSSVETVSDETVAFEKFDVEVGLATGLVEASETLAVDELVEDSGF